MLCALPRTQAQQQQQQWQQQQQQQNTAVPRRQALFASAGLLALGNRLAEPPTAAAFTLPPQGYRQQLDRLDGYNFIFPEEWAVVTSSGSDVFLRNPFNVDENLFVDISSPSSSR